MYLKINYAGSVKKVALKPELQKEAGFFELLSRIAGAPREDLAVTFTDLENEVVSLEDQMDLDYFLTSDPAAQFLTVNLSNKLAKATSECKVQTERVPTSEQCCETLAAPTNHCGQQADQTPVETKDTQTRAPETKDQPAMTVEAGLNDVTKMLLERVQALERSVLSQSQVLSVREIDTESTKAPEPQPIPARLTTSQVTTVHVGVTCDGCHKHNFVGKRFKCLVCPDFDLCETCEANNDHQHPMVRCQAQGDHFALEKLRAKYAKFTAGFGRCRRGPRGLGEAIRNIVEGLKVNQPGQTRSGCPFRAQREAAKPCTPEQPAKAPCSPVPRHGLEEKEEMLEFMLPHQPERWAQILLEHGHLPIIEFCEIVQLIANRQ